MKPHASAVHSRRAVIATGTALVTAATVIAVWAGVRHRRDTAAPTSFAPAPTDGPFLLARHR